MQIISVSNSSEKLMLTRVSRLRRLLRNALRTTKLPSVITSSCVTSSDVAESIHYVYFRSVVRRQRGAQQSHNSRSQQSDQSDLRRNFQREEADELLRVRHHKDQHPAETRANDSSPERQRHGFAHEQAKHAAPRE